ncbi:hypothetical protein OPV22_004616 [Ensete ventricosum]|uniref:Uncharacterized protein n=1 Tax=Ensete ventricosum TaxID=4639 RepID=A0AAV8RPR8_ENSVE|nr:hypothetical protein OPV22_004616 [Ensete ventricosum]
MSALFIHTTAGRVATDAENGTKEEHNHQNHHRQDSELPACIQVCRAELHWQRGGIKLEKVEEGTNEHKYPFLAHSSPSTTPPTTRRLPSSSIHPEASENREGSERIQLKFQP